MNSKNYEEQTRANIPRSLLHEINHKQSENFSQQSILQKTSEYKKLTIGPNLNQVFEATINLNHRARKTDGLWMQTEWTHLITTLKLSRAKKKKNMYWGSNEFPL